MENKATHASRTMDICALSQARNVDLGADTTFVLEGSSQKQDDTALVIQFHLTF